MNQLKQINTSAFKGQDFYIGLDVHKKSWKVTIRLNRMELKTFSMNPNPHQLNKHLNNNYPGGTYYSVYEAGFCGYWIHRQLCDLGINNRVVNGADVPTTHKEKDQKRDPIDSRKLARELENHNLKSVYIPSPKQQAVRSLGRLYFQITVDRTRIKNRIKSYLFFHGVEIPQPDEMTHWSAKFINWLKQIHLPEPEDRYHLNRLIHHLEDKRQESRMVLKYMKETAKTYPVIALLRSVCGIGFITAYSLYSELMDIRRFKNSDHLASYVGLVPSVRSSSDVEKTQGLSGRYSKYLRNRIIESAWVAIRTDPALTLSYNNYIKRMSKKKAIVRIAKKLLNRIRYVWINEKPYITGVVE